jgi:FkbM family methyltransferase|tara:strand:- start:6605 stop:7306 length:702 start_codon:yes stop_codon:yes gene_type:complete
MGVKLDGFDWGEDNGVIFSMQFRDTLMREFFNGSKNIYETVFQVEENDIVMDVGASIGPFPYSLKDRNIKHLYVIEPSKAQIGILSNNIKGIPNTIIPYVINDKDLFIHETFGSSTNQELVKSKKFMQVIKENNIEKIDFLKTDCEGGEYEIFSIENICWLKDNVGKCAGEWHLNNPETKQKFREFRDVFLRVFPNHEVYSVDGLNIKWDLWNDHFIEYYNEVIIHIDNRRNG